MIDTQIYIQWLYQQCRNKGARFVEDEIKGLLRLQADDLMNKYQAKLIINCSGLSAKELAGDEDVYPLRGEKTNVIAWRHYLGIVIHNTRFAQVIAL